ncbi:MAG: hypothetical protein EXR72_08455 [Myxococcales bacterium]|nr:hypothetical protein [Myxococcales bacterium]
MKPDPALATIREARKAISREFGNDPKRLVEYFMERQKQYGDRLVPGPGACDMEEGVRSSSESGSAHPKS